jgi:uncharacterized membrane protein YfhO
VPPKPPLKRASARLSIRAKLAKKARRVTVTVTTKSPGPVKLTITLKNRAGKKIRVTGRSLKVKKNRAVFSFTPPKTARKATLKATSKATSLWKSGNTARNVWLPVR